MEDVPTDQDEERGHQRKRIPKACGSCRQSKVKCDGKRPCTRCETLKKTCVFVEKVKDSKDERIELLERDLHQLRDQITARGDFTTPIAPMIAQESAFANFVTTRDDGIPRQSLPQTDPFFYTSPQSADTSATCNRSDGSHSNKRRKTNVEISSEHVNDFITQGLITTDQARSFWDSFFKFCDRFVPVFDPVHDTFFSVRARSGLLFNAICTVGCSVLNNAGSQLLHQLTFELKKWLNVIIVNRSEHCLETVQALLVHACYSAERSLILSLATRMALDLELHEAFGELSRRLINEKSGDQTHTLDWTENVLLMRKSRIWFGLLVLEHILRMDAGKLPGFTSKSGARRCRILLRPELSTPLDLRLLSQVELNFLRAKIHDSLSSSVSIEEIDVLDLAQDAKIDINVWFEDWSRIINAYPNVGDEKPALLLALEVQRCWSEIIAFFKALRLTGTENVSAMSSTGRNILQMAKEALKKHLEIIVSDPEHYLATFRYAMDFVWAKCAFCFLLLLKVNRLLPENEQDSYRLLSQGNILLSELNKAGSSAGSNTSRSYLQVLSLSIEKYGRALQEHQTPPNFDARGEALFSWNSQEAQAEFESFVPEQFVFEWDFPGLTLFSSPVGWQEFFDDFLFGMGVDNLNPLAG